MEAFIFTVFSFPLCGVNRSSSLFVILHLIEVRLKITLFPGLKSVC